MVEYTITKEEISKKRLMIATPMYGGKCSAYYTDSMILLERKLIELGIPHVHKFLTSESLISRARNYLAEFFMQSDCTHFLFIDADIAFNPQSVIDMLIIADSSTDKNIVAGPYPKKEIAWEKIKQAVDQGKADEDPSALKDYVGDFVVNAKSGSWSMSDVIPVKHTGTGFMMITRNVFEKFNETYPEMMYSPDHKRSPGFDGSKKITAFFMDYIDKELDVHLSEDYMFCQYAERMGFQTWICPWINLKHIGDYIFEGNFSKIASSGMNITFGENKN